MINGASFNGAAVNQGTQSWYVMLHSDVSTSSAFDGTLYQQRTLESAMDGRVTAALTIYKQGLINFNATNLADLSSFAHREVFSGLSAQGIATLDSTIERRFMLGSSVIASATMVPVIYRQAALQQDMTGWTVAELAGSIYFIGPAPEHRVYRVPTWFKTFDVASLDSFVLPPLDNQFYTPGSTSIVVPK